MENILTFVQNNYWWLALVAGFVYEAIMRYINTHQDYTWSKYLKKYFPKFVEILDKIIENKIKKP